MRYALINEFTVVNIIVADSDFAASISGDYQYVIQSDTAQIGDAYNSVSGEFTTPELPPEPDWPVIRTITVEHWLNRWSDETLGRVIRISESDTPVGDKVKGWLAWLDRQSAISLDDTRITDRIQQAVDAGKITVAEQTTLMADVQEGEL